MSIIIFIVVLIVLISCEADNTPEVCLTPEQVYEDTQACMGLTAPKPTVEFISFDERGLGDVWAVYHPHDWVVLVNDDRERTCTQERQILTHEYIHHILRYWKFIDESKAHDSEFWDMCDGWVNESSP